LGEAAQNVNIRTFCAHSTKVRQTIISRSFSFHGLLQICFTLSNNRANDTLQMLATHKLSKTNYTSPKSNSVINEINGSTKKTHKIQS